MASPRDLQLVPNAYEVIRLDTGHEICGMTRRVGEVTEITLPMICHLSATFKGSTVATFYPYSPLTSDTVIKIPEDMILHRNTMNPQVIPMYDSASSKWLGMIENQSIPLHNRPPEEDRIYETSKLDEIVRRLYEPHPDEESMEWLERMEEEFERERQALSEEEKFKTILPPKDKKKIH